MTGKAVVCMIVQESRYICYQHLYRYGCRRRGMAATNSMLHHKPILGIRVSSK